MNVPVNCKSFLPSFTLYCLCRLNPDEYFIDKLTVNHADYIAYHWTEKLQDKEIPIITKYLQNIIRIYNFSMGIFPRSDPAYPVSWVVYRDFGHTVFFHTLPEYRGNGFGENLVVKFSSVLLENNIYPLGEYIRDSYLHKKFSNVEKCFPNYTWRDSITGKCYW